MKSFPARRTPEDQARHSLSAAETASHLTRRSTSEIPAHVPLHRLAFLPLAELPSRSMPDQSGQSEPTVRSSVDLATPSVLLARSHARSDSAIDMPHTNRSKAAEGDPPLANSSAAALATLAAKCATVGFAAAEGDEGRSMKAATKALEEIPTPSRAHDVVAASQPEADSERLEVAPPAQRA